ncbi:MAG TPA: VWA domain-containing protein [Candidatus Angelobacter sp.]|nr:VWA domain-containing protein [Candidatus Angelobacter sp.]
MVTRNTWLIGCVVTLFLSSLIRPQTATQPPAASQLQTASQAQAQTPSTGQATQAQSAQKNPPADQTPQVYESASVLKAVTRMVVVDVVVTDKHGNTVTDLQRGDFTVSEDGNEQQIRVFSFERPGTSAAGLTASPATSNLPPNVFTNIPRYNPKSALNVILLDGLNTTVPDQAYVRQQMIRYLEKMPPGQPVAIYALSSKLTLLQDFTSDPEVLKDAMKKLKNHVSELLDNPGGGAPDEVLPPGVADSGMIPAQTLDALMRFEAERTSFQMDLRVSGTLSALTAISRSLSGYPGRKNLIWVSEAFPITIDPKLELTGDVFAGTRSYAREIGAAADALTDAQIAIYPIDARGLEVSSVSQASNTGRDQFGRSMGADPSRLVTAISDESSQLQAAHITMQDMAERTGGKAFYDRNDIDNAIRHSIEDGSTYYTLAYYPTNKNWNGKFRKIHVTVNRPEIKLRHRLGYYAVDPKGFVEASKQVQATLFAQALNLDAPVSTGLRFKAGVVPPSDQTQNKVLVNFALDPHALTFDSKNNDGLHHAVVDCVVQAYSTKGKLLRTESKTITASLKPDSFSRMLNTYFPCQEKIDLPAGSYLLRLGVRDGTTGLIGTAIGRVTVEAASGPAPAAETDPAAKKP